MNWIDLTLLVVLLLFGLRGYFRGLFREIFSLAGLMAGFLGATRYADSLSAVVTTHWEFHPILVKGVAFVLVFFFIYLLFNVAGWLIHRSAKFLFLQTVNRLGGVALGVGKGAAVTALLIFALMSTSLVPQATRDKLRDAYLVSPLARLAHVLINFGKANLFVKESTQERSSGFPRSA